MKMGDVGKVDKDGNMYITGRIKDIIILRNAKKINASQVRLLKLGWSQLRGQRYHNAKMFLVKFAKIYFREPANSTFSIVKLQPLEELYLRSKSL